MAKSKTVFICESCGATQPKWAGQCPDCSAWNTLVESAAAAPASPKSGAAAAGLADQAPAQVQTLSGITPSETTRTATGLSELDRVLGGGLVPGSVILIGGDPGIGKSTLLLQVLARLSSDLPALYDTGEESLEQIHLRAQRLGVADVDLAVLAETCVERILALAKPQAPKLLVVDSIQAVFTEALTSAPGNVAQLRESASMLARFAKATGTALILVGHVTKEGAIAGPRVLEHMVDTVLYFEAEASSRFRVVRSIKNRFGAVNELGVFAMSQEGLKQVKNPSAIFLSRHEQPVPGSAVMVAREGSRPMLVEVQALVDGSQLSNPRRVSLGADSQRLAMLLAVLHRHGGIGLGDQDVFLNVVGGMRVTETAADLAVVLAALSSFRDRAIGQWDVIFGEIGLAGEIRPVPGGEDRLAEAAKHGFKRAIVPTANAPQSRQVGELEVIPAGRLSDAIAAIE